MMTNQLANSPRPRSQHGFVERFIEPIARIDHLLDDGSGSLSAFQFGAVPALEMIENDDNYTVSVEVPGIAPEDIDLQVDRDMLVLKGEKKEEHEHKDRDYVISERSYGTFERRVAIPVDAVVDGISAETTNGVLRISIPRSAKAKAQKRKIEIHHSEEG